jgi:hypothetical protein
MIGSHTRAVKRAAKAAWDVRDARQAGHGPGTREIGVNGCQHRSDIRISQPCEPAGMSDRVAVVTQNPDEQCVEQPDGDQIAARSAIQSLGADRLGERYQPGHRVHAVPMNTDGLWQAVQRWMLGLVDDEGPVPDGRAPAACAKPRSAGRG